MVAISGNLGNISGGAVTWDGYLSRRHSWCITTLGRVPAEPKVGDREPVIHALDEIIDAAGGLEYSHKALQRAIAIAQEEFAGLISDPTAGWSGVNTPAVYYEFYNAIFWTRTVDDRYKDRLRPALKHDQGLWKRIQRIRQETARDVFDDARLLAKCALHKYTPPYANASAKVENGGLVYPIPRIIDADDFRANLQFDSERHAAVVAEEAWEAIARFIDKMLDVFHPPNTRRSL